MAASLKGIVKVAAVNCEDDKQLCGKHEYVQSASVADSVHVVSYCIILAHDTLMVLLQCVAVLHAKHCLQEDICK